MIIDVRTQEEWSDGHVEGAINVPLRDIEEGRFPFDND
ncbi:MAG: Rhodanese-like domain [Candidatus Parcubacteria bacterium]